MVPSHVRGSECPPTEHSLLEGQGLAWSVSLRSLCWIPFPSSPPRDLQCSRMSVQGSFRDSGQGQDEGMNMMNLRLLEPAEGVTEAQRQRPKTSAETANRSGIGWNRAWSEWSVRTASHPALRGSGGARILEGHRRT